MNETTKIILSDKGIRYAILLSGIMLIIEVVAVTLAYFRLPPIIPLFNSLSWGRDRLAPIQFIFIVPAFLFVLFVINTVFAGASYRKHALLSRMLAVNLLLSIALSFVALIQIALLVF